MTMLVYSSKGTQKKQDLGVNPALEIIGQDNMMIFKNIFDKPTKPMIVKFFKNNFIRNLWSMVVP